MIDPQRDGAPHAVTISTATFVKAILIVLALWFAWFIRDIIAIFLVAVLLAALIDPFADWFSSHSIPRGLAVIIVYIILFVLLTASFYFLIPVVVTQLTDLYGAVSSTYGGFGDIFAKFQNYFTEHGLTENARATGQSLQRGLTATLGTVFATVKDVATGVAGLFVVLVLTFYLVVEENAAKRFFKSLAPVEYQPYLVQLFTRMQKKIGAWLRGQIILCLAVGLCVYIGLLIIGVPYALLLALIAGLFELVPYVGPVVSLIPAAIIGFGQAPVPVVGLLVVALYLLVQQLENNLLVPKIMQKVTGLNPIVSIVALLVGIKIGGLVGALLAIPVATMVSVVLEDMFSKQSLDI